MSPAIQKKGRGSGGDHHGGGGGGGGGGDGGGGQEPIIDKPWKIPLLRLRVNDVLSEGAAAFFNSVNTSTLLKEAVVGVLEALYTKESQPVNVRSVTLVLRSMGGVAYTTGSEIDEDHKEIHFSTDYIAGVKSERVRDEILGVVRHEMVHCWQFNGLGSCPGGLIEGIADWVRLKAGFSPPHWKRGGHKWSDGYQNTAYFLEYCEEKVCRGFVSKLNEALREKTYVGDIWKELSGGRSVHVLWKEYKKAFDLGDDDHDGAHDSDDDGDGGDDGEDEKHGKDRKDAERGGQDPSNQESKCETSEDEDVDVVEREEAGSDLAPLDDEDDIASENGNLAPEEEEALFLRYKLQKLFLMKDRKPEDFTKEKLENANSYFEFLESVEIPQWILKRTKLGKAITILSKTALPNLAPIQNYNFQTRAHALSLKWGIVRSTNTANSKATDTMKNSTWEGGMKKHYQISHVVGPTPYNDDDDDATTAVSTTVVSMPDPRMHGGLAAGVRESEIDDDDNTTTYAVSTIHGSVGPRSVTSSAPSSSVATTSRRPSSSRADVSTKRGRGRRNSGGASVASSVAPSSSSDTTTTSWHGGRSGGEQQMVLIARKRLTKMVFTGEVDGRRFIKQFEALIDRVQPDMSDDDKRMLLTTCFKGQDVDCWYEGLDVDDSLPYEELKAALQDRFRGPSLRHEKLLEGGVGSDPADNIHT